MKSEKVRKIKVVLKRVNQEPEEIEIEDTLGNLQALVEGCIEIVRIGNREVAIICDDEGKLKHKTPNMRLLYQVGTYLSPTSDVLCGDLVFIALSSAMDRDFKSLTDKNRKFIKSYISEAVESL